MRPIRRQGEQPTEDTAGGVFFFFFSLLEPTLRSPWPQCNRLQVHLQYRAFPCVHQQLALVLPHLYGNVCADIFCPSWFLISLHKIKPWRLSGQLDGQILRQEPLMLLALLTRVISQNSDLWKLFYLRGS